MIDALPKHRRERIDARYREIKDEVESLRELRKAAGKAQAEIAATLRIKQPSVSKIEKQTDMYLSTLRSYVEAIGGERSGGPAASASSDAAASIGRGVEWAE
jgi:DNA-binding XRE family transcriptional regulator